MGFLRTTAAEPRPVSSPVSPDPVFNLLLGGALGLLIGVAAGFARTARGTTIGSPRRLQDLAAAPVLGDRRRP